MCTTAPACKLSDSCRVVGCLTSLACGSVCQMSDEVVAEVVCWSHFRLQTLSRLPARCWKSGTIFRDEPLAHDACGVSAWRIWYMIDDVFRRNIFYLFMFLVICHCFAHAQLLIKKGIVMQRVNVNM